MPEPVPVLIKTPYYSSQMKEIHLRYRTADLISQYKGAVAKHYTDAIYSNATSYCELYIVLRVAFATAPFI